jgi:hypothetical protein
MRVMSDEDMSARAHERRGPTSDAPRECGRKMARKGSVDVMLATIMFSRLAPLNVSTG